MKKGLSIQEALQQASSFLGDDFEAEFLLRQLLSVDRARFFMMLQEPFPKDLWEKWQEWLMRRKKQEPLQYIVGDQAFYGRLFQVDPRVLIPRPETEGLVELVLTYVEQRWVNEPLTMVDVGTGSGCIAITLALERKNTQLFAIDISSRALKVARANAQKHKVASRIGFRQGFFLEPVLGESFQVLISNPPYIPSQVVPTLETQVAKYEPHLALDGGEDGLFPYRVMAEQLRRCIRVDRRLIALEIGAEQGKDVVGIFRDVPGVSEIKVHQDYAGRDRYILAWCC